MALLSNMLFWFGILAIPLSWAMWHWGARIEIERHVMDRLDDPALKAVLQEAHAERWGLFIGLWPVTLLVLSHLVELRFAG